MKAFPLVAEDNKNYCEYQLGMDLRDYFAAKCLPLAFKVWENYFNSEDNDDPHKTSNFQADGHYPTLIADTAYEMADAMMKVREKQAIFKQMDIIQH